jgi:hypothetical protein
VEARADLGSPVRAGLTTAIPSFSTVTPGRMARSGCERIRASAMNLRMPDVYLRSIEPLIATV